MMASTQMASGDTRSTRQSTTRSSVQARPLAQLHQARDDKQPSLETRSRQQSSSSISSLSPSPQKVSLSLPSPGPGTTTSSPAGAQKLSRVSRDKGKGKAHGPPLQGEQGRPGKRVLPARIRRAAGGGQEGFRDLENMIVDWLDRYGYPNDCPPDSLRITITSLPLDQIDPPVESAKQEVPTEQITITPNEAGPSTARGMIETPDWIKVTSGQDDEEEAREELLVTRNPVSPLRRLRRLSASNEGAEDVSDEYYHRLHKRYEAIEKRQRKDERDKLTHERYRMRTRIDLLKSISSGSWSSVVWTVLARDDPTGLWDKGKMAVKVNGIEWLRRRLVKEGEEVMRRYDSMLPVDPRKSKVRDEKSIIYMSESPPPTALPARVLALKSKEVSDRRKSLPAPLSSQTQTSRKRRQSESTSHTSSRPMRKPRQASTVTIPSEGEVSDTDSDPLSDAPSESDSELGAAPHEVASSTSSTGLGLSTTTPSVRPEPARPSGRPPPRKRPSPPRTTTRVRLPAAAAAAPPPPQAESEKAQLTPLSTGEKWVSEIEGKHSETLQSGIYELTGQIQDQVSPDEQLDLERVEAAVVI